MRMAASCHIPRIMAPTEPMSMSRWMVGVRLSRAKIALRAG